jgi:alkanesulfonate monooxygenase SsuD/methylene tetrahydromethanopterin reductase-like flavin-dependent oxidoreductase (luciferase family)
MTRLLFGISLSTSAAPGADPVADARAAEEAGFDFVSASDHPGGTHPSYETWTLLTWIAAATTRVMVMPKVLGVPFRAPALVAKAAESLDRLSSGRLLLGLGGGFDDSEFRALGLPVRTPGEKIRGLEDAMHIIYGMWREPGFTHTGTIYRTEGAQLEPKPEHRIPVWLGTFGPRALELTGRLADGWIPSRGYVPDQAVADMRERVAAAAMQAGRDPAAITYALNTEVTIDDRNGHDADQFTGPPAKIAESVHHYAELGFTAFNFLPAGGDPAGQVRRLATEVLPAVRTR